MQRLFVYGTLAPGQINHNFLENIKGVWEPATLRGNLIQAGWGAEMGCPGIVPAENGDEVPGFVLSSEQLIDHWSRLDEFEGAEYERVMVSVTLANEQNVEAYVYALKGDT
ncbi:MAG: gamma-glutamylcyclotransferase family protein [Cyanobacteria bacterium J06632_3]